MDVDYFMGSASARVLHTVSSKYLWANALSSSPSFEKEYRDRLAERITAAVQASEEPTHHIVPKEGRIAAAAEKTADIAVEASNAQITQRVKNNLFASSD